MKVTLALDIWLVQENGETVLTLPIIGLTPGFNGIECKAFASGPVTVLRQGDVIEVST